MPKKDLVAKTAQVPEKYLDKGIPIGTELLTEEDILLPRIRIIQKTSEDVEEGAGNLRNSVTDQTHKSITVIPLFLTKGRVHFMPDDTTSGPDCRSMDRVQSFDGKLCRECELKNWGPNNEAPECAETIDIPILYEDGIAALSFKRTGLTPVKKFLTTMKFRNVPLFFYHIEITTVKTKSSKGEYYIPTIKITNETTEEERNNAFNLVKVLIGKKLEVHWDPKDPTQPVPEPDDERHANG